MTTKLFTFTGPWTGIEERGNFQTEKSASISINVDYSRGYIESRKGFYMKAATGLIRPMMHVAQPRFVPQRLLFIGDRTGSHIGFITSDLDGNMGALQNLTTLGEPYDPKFHCSFLEATLIIKDDSVPAKVVDTRFVTIITTKHSSYIYDAVADIDTVRRVNMTTDVKQTNKANVSYFADPPRGNIAIRHKGMYFYAGFKDHQQVLLTDPIEETQNIVPEYQINEDRSKFTFDPAVIFYSDIHKFADISGHGMLAVDAREKVTGLADFQDTLVVFTDRGIYNIYAAGADTIAMPKVIEGSGCIAPGSVVDIGEAILYMSQDGIYAYYGGGAQGTVKKISDQIDSIFTHRRQQSHAPIAVEEEIIDKGYPYYISRAFAPLCQGVHYRTKNQVWWSIPQAPTGNVLSADFRMTLVYDYRNKAWGIWLSHYKHFFSADTAMVDGEEMMFTVGADGILSRFGMSDVDYDGSNETSPEVIWVSGTLFRGNDTVSTYRPLRFKMLSAGRKPTDASERPQWFMEGEESAFDGKYVAGASTVTLTAAADRQATQGDLDLHPNESLNNFYSVDASPLGVFGTSAAAGTALFEASDWFTSKAEPGTVKSRTLKIGIHDPPSEDRGPKVCIKDFSIEVDGGDLR